MKPRHLAWFFTLLLTGCVTRPVNLTASQPEWRHLTGWVDMNKPFPGSVQITVSILMQVQGQLLPRVTARYQASSLPLQYDFRQLPLNSEERFYLLAELRWPDNPALQASKQVIVVPGVAEKIMLIPLPCFPYCQISEKKQIKS